ncbi:endonuclease MutS2 [Carnobacteriaceae bacterium zg-ZUI78]|nr:endonuclease MutS2 [Carnobacteriaceae bacterium zg-ZUI78]
MDTKTLKKLEFDKVLQQLASFTSSELGKQKVLALHPFSNREQVMKHLEDTDDAVLLLRLKGGIPSPILKDITPHVKRLEIGATLNAKEIADIGRVLTTAKEVERFFVQVEEADIILKRVHHLAKELVVLPHVFSRIKEAVSDDGEVLDTASPELRRIRTSQKRAEQQVKEALENILRQKQSQLTDAVITIRNDRYVLPVKQEFKHTFGGSVQDQSASGQTVFIEPTQVQDLNNKRHALQVEERQEIERILWEIVSLLVPHISDIYINHQILAELDFINAKALYAKQLRAMNVDVSDENEVALYGARHPLIDAKLVVKNDVLLGGEYQCIVITGPNTGGKTILLKTVGLLQVMAQSGLHIPVDEGSQIAVFENVFADIGDEQSIEQSLSTFSSHMTNIISILQGITHKSLVLFDELGAGTDPQEGASLAIAILDHIGTVGSYVIATTHYPELKMYGYNRSGTINASMEFDTETLVPTYKFLLGIPGRSNAFDISKRLGLNEHIIQEARELIDEETQSLNEMISALETMRQDIAKEKEQVEKDLKQAKAMLAEVEEQKRQFEEEKDTLEERAKKEANAIVESASQEAESIISDIRRMQLEQGKAVIKEHEFIAKKTALSQLKHEESLKKNKVLQKAKRQKNLKVGDSVEVMSYGQRGILNQKVNETEWVVQMGMLKMKVPVHDIRLIDSENPKQKKYIPTLKGGRATKVTSQLDLRGQRYDNALVELDRYLDAAILSGYPQVTIIHGRGTGAIREGVTKHLKQHRGVLSFEFAPINQGGNGATIVKFKN